MTAITILYPCFGLVFLTMIVWACMLLRRALHMKTLGIKPADMPTREAADARLGHAQAPNNNLMNLFELPVLFYVVTILIFQLQLGDTIYLTLAWLFVGLRAGQSAVHLTYNNVLHRGLFYLLSCCALWLIWLRLAYQLVTAGAV